MDIKTFKEGVTQLSALTNQRAKEPEPFAIQYGKDGRVSLLAANEACTIVWDIGYSDMPAGRHGISSKMLYQAAKVLKGKGSVDFVFDNWGVEVHVAGGGKVKLPYEQQPVYYHRPDREYAPWLDQYNLVIMRDRLSAVLPSRENYIVASPVSPDQTVTIRLNASNGYVVWESQTMPQDEISEAIAWRIDSLTSFKMLDKNSIVYLGEKSVKVEALPFTMYTRLLREDEFIHYPSLKTHHYPEGKKPPVAFEVGRKALEAAIKAVSPDAKKDKDQQFRMVKDVNSVHITGIQHQGSVEVPIKRGYGNGSVALGAIHTLPVLKAFDANDILVVFSNPQTPVGFKSINNPYESYLVAPVFKA